MKKRFICWFLTLCLMLTFLPAASAYGPSEAEGFTSVSAGQSHGLAVKADGTLWAWGNNRYGQLGNGESGAGKYKAEPVQILDKVVSASAGGAASAAIRTDGSLWVWGNVGLDPALDGSAKPVKVLDGVAAVSCGNGRFFAVKADGTLWAWGLNPHNELGLPGLKSPPESGTVQAPTQMLDQVTAVSAGENYALALKKDGTLWSWGWYSAPLGLGADPSVTDYTTETPYTPGDSALPEHLRDVMPYPMHIMSGIVSMTGGYHHTMAVRKDGGLWTWGGNLEGQLGNGTSLWYDSPVQGLEVKINGTPRSFGVGNFQMKGDRVLREVASASAGGSATGGSTSFAVKTDGTLWAWGSAWTGRLGFGAVGNAENGGGKSIQSTPRKVMDGVFQVSAGGTFTAAVKTDGTLWTWGDGTTGELANGKKVSRQTTPVQVLEGAAVDVLSTETVRVDGRDTALAVYRVVDSQGGGTSYFKLRDLAMLLSGSDRGFDVAWNAATAGVDLLTGQLYTVAGGELVLGSAAWAKPANPGLTVNGKPVTCGAYAVSAVFGAPVNYYVKLRDVAALVGFTVGWDQGAGVVVIDTGTGQDRAVNENSGRS